MKQFSSTVMTVFLQHLPRHVPMRFELECTPESIYTVHVREKEIHIEQMGPSL